MDACAADRPDDGTCPECGSAVPPDAVSCPECFTFLLRPGSAEPAGDGVREGESADRHL